MAPALPADAPGRRIPGATHTRFQDVRSHMSQRDKEPQAGATTDDPEMTPSDAATAQPQAGVATPQADGDDGATPPSCSNAIDDAAVRNLQSELSTLQDRHRRLAAESDNYRK